MRKSTLLLALLGLTIFFISTGYAQWELIPRSHDDWTTLETEHFNIHYTPDLEAWVLQLAPELESINTVVSASVGYNDIRDPVNVFIMDPMGMPNGMAIPVAGEPRIILWPTAPVNPLMLGGLETWHEIVMVHEYTHAVHLTRRTRSWQGRVIRSLLPVSPLALKLPTWITEGFAVLMETELTGYGRGTSSLRSMLLCQLGTEGKLPEFSELNGGDQWLGGRYPYFVGSAFLQWLRDGHENPDCLLHLWKRMTARTNRSFDDAFRGVFQDDPEDLYDRFRAELTVEALALEEELSDQGIVEGTPWQYIKGDSGQPAISPDGLQMAVVLRPYDKPSELKIWSLSETKEQDPDPALDDPEDVSALPHQPPVRKTVHEFKNRHGISPGAPRWMPDGDSLLFHSLRMRSNGDLRCDVYRWWPVSDRLDRVTHGASLSWVDPFPNGNQAVCLYQKNGLSGIQILDIKTGETSDLIEPSLSPVWQTPRVSPDGTRVVSIRRLDHRCELVLIDLKTSEIEVMYSGPREVLVSPVWSRDGQSIYVCNDKTGVMNVRQLDVATKQTGVVTRSLAGVLFPEIGAQDDELYLIKPHAKGMDIHHVEIEPMSDLPDHRGKFKTVLPPLEVSTVQPFESSVIPEPHDYRLTDHLHFGFTGSGSWLPYYSTTEAGIYMTDILGRLRVLALGGYGWNGGPEGFSLSLGFNGFPVKSSLKGFSVKRDPTSQRLVDSMEVYGLEHTLTGGELAMKWRRTGSNSSVLWRGGFAFGRYDFDSAQEDLDRWIAGSEVTGAIHGNWGNFRIGGSLNLMGAFGSTDSNGWEQFQGVASGFSGWKSTLIKVKYTSGKIQGDFTMNDVFTTCTSHSSIEPDWFHGNQIELPWLPDYALNGESFERWDIELILGSSSPWVLYGSELSMENGSNEDIQRVAGLEMRISIPAIPMVYVGASQVTVGVAHGFDGMIEDDWRGYVSFRLLP